MNKFKFAFLIAAAIIILVLGGCEAPPLENDTPSEIFGQLPV